MFDFQVLNYGEGRAKTSATLKSGDVNYDIMFADDVLITAQFYYSEDVNSPDYHRVIETYSKVQFY